MKVLVTGANKGIGLAIVNKLLRDEPSISTVYLGARDQTRGIEAVKAIESAYPPSIGRVKAIVIDVCSQESIKLAAESIPDLDGLINNAGIAHGDIKAILETNLYGVKCVTDAFLPALSKATDGRVVNISSASGPMFVAKCSDAARKIFTNPNISWQDFNELIEQVVNATPEDQAAICQKQGLPDSTDSFFAYGFSKACLNCLSMIVARENPQLSVNGCSPGYIETDLTKPFAEAQNKTPAEMGMKTTDQGALAPCQLLLSDRSLLKGNGWYYGSDAKRSPLDIYRSPGDPEYIDE